MKVPTGERIGTVIAGRYTLVEVIGEGGMGSVYLASQTEPVKRQVALKLIKTGMDSKAVLARFDAERQALALMDHPNIARIYDGGLTPAGQPFFVMELVRGVPLTEYCDRQRLSVKARLELFVAVCQAVQHAHQKGIIHRDLKPGNVLVTEVDGRPTPKVIDFGVAKATEMKLTDMSLADTGAIVGTPAYMSPEQADPSSMDIDTRTDVYALGVMLYELLAGSPPLDARQFQRGAILEMLRMVREVDPPRPSTRLSTAEALPSIAANRSIEPARLANLLRGELDWVVMKALEKDRTRRYETADGFARDLQRYLADEIVEARPPSAGYRLKKFVRRNPLQLALAATVALLVLGGGAVVWWQGVQAGARRESDLRRQLEDDRRLAADNARLGRNAEAVTALLDQSEEALRAGDTAKASLALGAARKRATEGGAAEQANRLARLEADLALSRDLDDVDQFRWTPVENKVPGPAAVATRTRQVLARFEADPEQASVDEVAARVTASRVRERIVSALDRLLLPIRLVDVDKFPAEEQKAFTPQLWADVASLMPKRAGVRAVLRRVDADRYRDAIRDAIVGEDRANFVELAGQKAALEQPPGFVAFLGETPAIVVERRRQLLQAAVSRRPGDLGLLMALGNTYTADDTNGMDERLRWFQAAVAAAPANPAAHTNLGYALTRKGQWDEAIACCRKAIELDPKLAIAHCNLGNALTNKGQWDEAIACCRKAIELDPKDAVAHSNLGRALYAKGQWDEAIACCRKAIELDPKLAMAHNNLGIALYAKGQWDEAIACCRKAIELDPKEAIAHSNLGIALTRKGQWDEAIACCRKAIELDPKLAAAHCNLGNALTNKGQLDEAIACLKKAIELDPKLASAHHNLGNALTQNGQLDEAIACLKKAIELDPKLASAHHSLGISLTQNGQLDEAIACYRKAIALDPKLAAAHSNLGNALTQNGQLDEAIECYKKTIALDLKYAEAHCNMGSALASQGRFAESLEAYKRGHELGSKQPTWRYPSAEWVHEAEANAAMEAKLPAFLKGEFQPDDTKERLVLAGICHGKKLYQKATTLYAAAFAADPKLADDLKAAHRYDAACYATRAAAGQGNDAAELDDKERARLRQQARDWLRADLALWTKQLEAGKTADRTAVQQMLSHWHKDPDLAGIRDTAALAKLPGEEQKACTQLWADVAAVLKTANAPPSFASLLEQLPRARKALPKDSPQLAGLLAQIGVGLLEQKKWTEAEPLLRECLAIREKVQPDAWSTFNTNSVLGGALLGQKKYAEAEPLLIGGYEGMKRRENTIPEPAKARLPEAVERLVQLYEAMDRKDEAAKYRKELDAIKAAQKTPEKQP